MMQRSWLPTMMVLAEARLNRLIRFNLFLIELSFSFSLSATCARYLRGTDTILDSNDVRQAQYILGIGDV